MFFAWFIYTKFTRLGDTSGYINSSINFTSRVMTDSTFMMQFFGGISGTIFGHTVLSNLPFVFLSFYGIYYALHKINISNRHLLMILLLLSLPSFGVWSSIASKEAVGVFFMGIILGYIVDLYNDINRKIKLIEYFAFYLAFVFKPQYLIAILSLIIFIKLFRRYKSSANFKLFFFLFYSFMIIVAFYLLRDIVNALQYIIPNHFIGSGESTRENTIWVNDYDLYYNMFYGMFIAWWGPTLSEVIVKPIQVIAFLESAVIFSFFLYFLLYIVKSSFNKKRVNIYLISLIIIPLFWLLFAHYPFGVFNPGSALRYRENFYSFFVIFFYFIYLEFKYRRRI
jgi:hypothetical protein